MNLNKSRIADYGLSEIIFMLNCNDFIINFLLK